MGICMNSAVEYASKKEFFVAKILQKFHKFSVNLLPDTF